MEDWVEVSQRETEIDRGKETREGNKRGQQERATREKQERERYRELMREE
jgi:hypothetical protein